MKLLAIDTALASCSVCVFDDVILAAEQIHMERGHAEALAPMVDRVMKQAGASFKDLHRIAVTTGPGTFTGIRVGLSFARSLGVALNIKVVGVNSMIATQVAVTNPESSVVVVHKAGQSGFYYVYLESISTNIELLKIEDLLEVLPLNCTVVGTGAEEVAAVAGVKNLKRLRQFDLPVASGFAAFAAAQAEPFTRPEPLSLREADAKPQNLALRPIQDLLVLTANKENISQLAHIHSACFDEAWDERALENVLDSAGTFCVMVRSKSSDLGLLIYRIVLDEAEILTLGVSPASRRRGAARTMIAMMLENLKLLRVSNVFLEVARSNAAAIALYRNLGFVEVGVRKAYYKRIDGQFEDALNLRLSLM